MLSFLKRAPSKPIQERVLASKYQMPEAESAAVESAYRAANVVLEYGSGKSTFFAAGCADTTVFSVESDVGWMEEIQDWLDSETHQGTVKLHHGDIGQTGSWGKPIGSTAFRQYPNYPLSVWDRPDFEHPDVVLIDGRFRTACFITTVLRISRPTVVLFDDYTDRPHYHVVERFCRPKTKIGRLARFDVTPQVLKADDLSLLAHEFTKVV